MSQAASVVEPSERGHRLVTSGLVLSAFSFALVLYSASAEPFMVFSWFDFVLNVVIGALLFGLFGVWAALCVRKLRAQRPSRTWLACACVLWAAINLFYLGTVACGYVQDLGNSRLHPLR